MRKILTFRRQTPLKYPFFNRNLYLELLVDVGIPNSLKPEQLGLCRWSPFEKILKGWTFSFIPITIGGAVRTWVENPNAKIREEIFDHFSSIGYADDISIDLYLYRQVYPSLFSTRRGHLGIVT